MNKICTSIEQSKKLIELGIDIHTADMCYRYRWHNNNFMLLPCIEPAKEPITGDIPAWSLAALLNYLKSKNKFPEIKELSDGRFALTTYIWDGEDCIQNSIGVTIVDACYDIIIKLHEQNIL